MRGRALAYFIIAVMATGGIVQSWAQASVEQRPLSLLFLIDASGSMMENDPGGVRKAAAQAVVSLLSSEDEVAMLEFSTDCRDLGGMKGKTWHRAGDRTALNEVAMGAGASGNTDFSVALQRAYEVLEKGPGACRKMIIMLTDGILDLGRDSAQKNPEARTRIECDVLPRLHAQGTEIFTVGLSRNADRAYLEKLASATSRTPGKCHSFFAAQDLDLVGVFAGILQYVSNQTVLYRASDSITLGQRSAVRLDAFISQGRVLAVVRDTGELLVETPSNKQVAPDTGLHPKLLSCELPGELAGVWHCGFRSGHGQFRMIWVGQNLLTLEVEGLDTLYRFGEPVECCAYLKPLKGVPQGFLTDRIVGEDSGPGGSQQNVELVPEPGHDKFRLRYQPDANGVHSLKLEAYARDKQGSEICPRPSLKHKFRVLASFDVSPRELNYGRANRSGVLKRRLHIVAGLGHEVGVAISGEVKRTNNPGFNRGSGLGPKIHGQQFSMKSYDDRSVEIELELPANSFWADGGDYEGEIAVVLQDGGETIPVAFRVHIQTAWEFFRLWVVGLCVLGAGILGFLVYVWGVLPSPSGVLTKMQGDLSTRPYFRLGSLKHGLAAMFGPRRNVLTIAQRNAAINLPGLPPAFRAQLSFHRFGPKALLTNASPAKSGLDIKYTDPITHASGFRMPGRSVELRDKSIMEFCGYQYRFDKRK
jgi:Mg-chelatase subunit ChlD